MIDERWSANKLKTWHRCPRKFHNNYILGLGEPSNAAQDFGTVGHAVLENRLTEFMGGNGPAWPTLSDAFDQARLEAVLAGYSVRWETDRAEYTVLAVEQAFEFALGGHVFQGRMDGIVQRNADGRVFGLEHKFSGSDTSVGSSYFEKLALDSQVSVYVDALIAMGYENVEGVLYDVIARPRHERRLATPAEDRTLTKGKGCKVCGGKAAGVQGSGKRITSKGCTPAVANDPCPGCPACECPACGGLGWEEAPRLHKGQRDTDETPDEFYARVVEDIASRPDDYYTRVVVTRTEADMQRARASILDTIKLARIAEVTDIFPMNDSSCFAFNSRCPFWLACVGVDDINDRNRFPLKVRP